MKKILALLLALAMLLALVACSGNVGVVPTDKSSKPTTNTIETTNGSSDDTQDSTTGGDATTETTTPPTTEALHTHSYTSTATKNATCTEKGYTTYACSCGDSYTADEVAAKGHSYSKTVTTPTCTTQGYTTYTCPCGDTYTADQTAAKGHSYSKTVTAPTCTTQGYTTYICSCGDTYTADQTATKGHSYSKTVTAPTCTTQGYTTYACSCGDSYKDNYVSAKHNYQNYKCTSCGAIDKDHAYEYLTNWVLENGEPSGAYTYVDYYSGDTCFSFGYSANYDYTFASLSFSSEGQFFYTHIAFDNYNFYTSFDDNEVSGRLNASTFTSNSPISYSSYIGDDNDKYDMIDLSRIAVCDILDWAKWFLVEYNVGVTLSDLGFTAY